MVRGRNFSLFGLPYYKLLSLYILASVTVPEEIENIDALEFFSATRPNFELITCIYDNGSEVINQRIF